MATDQRAQYRADYDHHERLLLEAAGYDRQDGPNLVRHMPRHNDYGFVTYTKPHDFDIEAEIAQQEAECKAHCQVLEWKLYSHDPHCERLRAALVQRGFSVGEEEYLLVYDLSEHAAREGHDRSNSSNAYKSLDIRRVSSAEDITALVDVQNIVFAGTATVTPDRLIANQVDRQRDANVSVDDLYGVYVQGSPVAVSRLSHNPPSPFAGMWGGGTLEEHRGKGYYTAMVYARADAAIALGKKYLFLEAASTSKPIVEGLGFQHIASTWPCEKVLV